MHMDCEDQMSRHLQRTDAMTAFFKIPHGPPKKKRRVTSQVIRVVDRDSEAVFGFEVSCKHMPDMFLHM